VPLARRPMVWADDGTRRALRGTRRQGDTVIMLDPNAQSAVTRELRDIPVQAARKAVLVAGSFSREQVASRYPSGPADRGSTDVSCLATDERTVTRQSSAGDVPGGLSPACRRHVRIRHRGAAPIASALDWPLERVVVRTRGVGMPAQQALVVDVGSAVAPSLRTRRFASSGSGARAPPLIHLRIIMV